MFGMLPDGFEDNIRYVTPTPQVCHIVPHFVDNFLSRKLLGEIAKKYVKLEGG